MKKCLFLIALVQIVFSPLTGKQFNDLKPKQKHYTLLGLGDSITEGGENFHSYLFPLWETLFSNGYLVNFIGPNAAKCRIGTLNHAGFSGKNAEFLELHIDSIYKKYPADVVLIHSGHNHFAEEKPVQGIIKAHRSIIKKILAINPSAIILEGLVIPSGKLPKYSYINDLNQQLKQMVKELRKEYKHSVYLVDQNKNYDWETSCIDDKVHPNSKGAEIMANVWFNALEKVLEKPIQSFSPEILSYKKLGSGALNLHVFKPKDLKKGDKRPAIVFFFGGGWTNGTPLQFYRECAYYASKGLVAISADYRIASLQKTTPFESVCDAKSAIRFIRQNAVQLNIDENRIIAAGASAGGHLAAATATLKNLNEAGEDTLVSAKPNLLILYYAVVDNSARGYGFNQMKDRYTEISPVHHIDASTPPTLFILGTKDNLVPVETVQLFKKKMDDNKNECDLIFYEGAGHPIFYYREGVSENYYKMINDTEKFLQKHDYFKW